MRLLTVRVDDRRRRRGRRHAPSPTGSTRIRVSATTAAAACGRCRPAGHLTVYSLVRGPWELRLTRVDALADGVDAAALRLRVGGWAVAGDAHGHHSAAARRS